jgi:outer membrane protein assembly factor BamA
MPVFPFTIAARAFTVGRYGKDADDPRLSSFFVGFPGLVRGYESNSFRAADCTLPPAGGIPVSCLELDDLLGSKVLVFNVEPRLPLLGPIGVLARGPFPPLDLITFFDAGMAWTNDEGPKFVGCDTCVREFVKSVGVGLRLNLFGLLSLEGSYVNPIDRENKGWFFLFTVNSGF